MPVSLYVGLHGAGKTYGAIKHIIIPAINQGRTIVTNIPLNYDALVEYTGKRFSLITFSTDDLKLNPNIVLDFPNGAAIIIDEAWDVWPQGLKATQIEDSHKKLLTMHRHNLDAQGNSQVIVFLSQFEDGLAMFMRKQCHEVYVIEKCSELGLIGEGMYTVKTYKGYLVKQSALISETSATKYKKSLFPLYVSHTQSTTKGVISINEKRLDLRNTIWNSFLIKAGIPFILIVGSLVIWFAPTAYSNVFGDSSELSESEIIINSIPQTQNNVSQHGKPAIPVSAVRRILKHPPKADKASPSSVWRLAGVYQWQNKKLPAIAQIVSRTGYRNISLKDCKFNNMEWLCMVDGQLVANWTGAEQSGLGTANVENFREIKATPSRRIGTGFDTRQSSDPEPYMMDVPTVY